MLPGDRLSSVIVCMYELKGDLISLLDKSWKTFFLNSTFWSEQ